MLKIQFSSRARRSAIASCLLAVIADTGLSAAYAQDVKDLMGRSQSQSQQRAVEDLIKKLQGNTGSKPPVDTPRVETPRVDSPGAAEPARTAAPASTPPSVAPASAPDAPPVRPQIATSPSTPSAPTPQVPMTSEPDGAPPLPPPQPAQSPSRPAVRPAVRPAEVAPSPPASQPAQRVDTARLDAMPSVDIDIYFDYNSAAITPQAAATLSVLAQALKDPSLAKARFLIGGHTDGKGGAQFNLELSERRAQSVRRYLIDRHGLEASRLVAQGFGLQRPKVAGNPMDVQNRRVQVVNLTGASQ